MTDGSSLPPDAPKPSPVSYGKRPNESDHDYRERLWRDVLRRRAIEAGEPPPPPAAPSPVSHAAMEIVAPRAPDVPAEPAAIPPAESVHAWQNVGKSLGQVIGPMVEKVRWIRGRVFNPKVWSINVRSAKRPARTADGWGADVMADFSKKRVVNQDISINYAKPLAREMEELARKGRGSFQRGMEALGESADQSRENVRKFIRWLEDAGWLGTLNALYRDPETRELRRDENVYILFDKETAAEISAVEDPSKRALKRESRTLSRGAILWGLMVRPWGLNAAPSPSNRHDIRRHPAPA